MGYLNKIIFFLILSFLIGPPFSITSLAYNSESLTNASDVETQNQNRVLISVETLLTLIKEDPEIILIDVRSIDEFNRLKIPRSINIPQYAIKTRSFLKSKSIVLINKGINMRDLEQTCLNLREMGFKSYALFGGLNAWRCKTGSIEGDSIQLNNINMISPKELLRESASDELIVLDVSQTKTGKHDDLIPGIISVPFDNEKRFFIRFHDLLKKNQSRKYLTIVLLNEKGEDYESIEKVVKRAGSENTFFLKGGIESYKEFLNQQAMLKNREKISSEKQDSCRTCSE